MQLQKNEEKMLEIIIKKYDGKEKYKVMGSIYDLPDYMKSSMEDSIKKLKEFGYLSNVSFGTGGGWNVILTPEAFEYFDQKKN